jgi:CRISPR-associated endonuclease/helicase Cas3
MDFALFFERATGTPPFPYQRHFAESDVLPDLLAVPTGAGKTATAVLGWLWRRRHRCPEQTPRRLIFCLPMRTLVEQTFQVTQGWLQKLGLGEEVGLHLLMGGAVDEDWEGRPERDSILIGTQDQLLSRALNRGYGMSRFRWPVHFALLNNDCLWVIDETQLFGVGLSTTAQLQAFRKAFSGFGPQQTLWMSATLDPAQLGTIDFRTTALRRMELGPADLEGEDNPLRTRLEAKKPIQKLDVVVGKDLDVTAKALAKEVVARHRPGSRSLVVINRVERAQKLFDLLRKAKVECRLIHSRFRPADRRRAQAEALGGSFQGVIVATQAIEAGVDISARLLITELAPYSSMVQRFGRCNRRGEYTDAEVFWIDVEEKQELPYSAGDLGASRNILCTLTDAGIQNLPPGPPASGPELPVIRRREFVELFDTSADLGGMDLDISCYIRASEERDVQVAWRRWTGDAPPDDMAPLQRDELCTVNAWTLKKGKHPCWRWDSLEGKWRKEEVERLRPGMTLLLPSEAGGYDPELGFLADLKGEVPEVERAALPVDVDGDDPWTCWASNAYISLKQHSSEVQAELRRLREALGGELPWETLEEAALWHDLGKAHPAFQNMLLSKVAEEDPLQEGRPWAKSDGRPTARNERPHFRHELASALAWIQQDKDDLGAYLVAAHHGKVRLRLRARPTERPPEPTVEDPRAERPYALGIHDGDVLPTTVLSDSVKVPELTLRLRLMELGEADGRRSWAARSLALLEKWGPFKLAYLESLVRVADWRGTNLHARSR